MKTVNVITDFHSIARVIVAASDSFAIAAASEFGIRLSPMPHNAEMLYADTVTVKTARAFAQHCE